MYSFVAFLIPIVQHILTQEQTDTRSKSPSALILTPSKELCWQTSFVLSKFLKAYKESVGETPPFTHSIAIEHNQLYNKFGPSHILLSTPTVVAQHHTINQLLRHTSTVVVDEVDSILQSSNSRYLKKVINMTRKKEDDVQKGGQDSRRTIRYLFVGATLSISEKTKSVLPYLQECFPQSCLISTDGVGKVPASLTEDFLPVPEENSLHWKLSTLLSIIKEHHEKYSNSKILVFCNSLKTMDQCFKHVKSSLKQELNVTCLKIQADTTMEQRLDNLKQAYHHFDKHTVIVATDILARGMDFDNIQCVIQFDFASNKHVYLHRSGRTARAGRDGKGL
jgi:superfamily II DNA/RNA helicase